MQRQSISKTDYLDDLKQEYFHNGKWDEEKVIKRCHAILKDEKAANASVNYVLGAVHSQQGKYNEASLCYVYAAELGYLNAYDTINELLKSEVFISNLTIPNLTDLIKSLNNAPKNLPIFNHFQESSQKCLDPNSLLGKIYQKEENKAYLEEILEETLSASQQVGLAYLKKKNWREAIEAYTKVTAHSKSSEDLLSAYLNMGFCYGQIGEYDKAINNYNQAIKLDTKNQKAHYNRALNYYYWYKKKRYTGYFVNGISNNLVMTLIDLILTVHFNNNAHYEKTDEIIKDLIKSYPGILNVISEIDFSIDNNLEIAKNCMKIVAELKNNKKPTKSVSKQESLTAENIGKFSQAEIYNNIKNLLKTDKQKALILIKQCLDPNSGFGQKFIISEGTSTNYWFKPVDYLVAFRKILSKEKFFLNLSAKEFYAHAITYKNAGNSKEAIYNLNQALELSANYPDPYLALGNIYLDQKLYDQAAYNFIKVTKLIKQDTIEKKCAFKKLNQIGTIFASKEGGHEEAVALFEYRIKKDPINCKSSCINLGICFSKLNHSNKAIEYFNKAIALKEDFSVAYLQRGLEYTKLESYDKAIVDFTKTLELIPQTVNLNPQDEKTAKQALEQIKKLLNSSVSTLKKINIDYLKAAMNVLPENEVEYFNTQCNDPKTPLGQIFITQVGSIPDGLNPQNRLSIYQL